MNRIDALVRFYVLIERLERRLTGKRTLGDSRREMGWPNRGVYFFFEEGERRADSGSGLRVVRVGTHALKVGAKSTLWQRLSAHRGGSSGGGNQRGSIFRRLVGDSILGAGRFQAVPSWNVGSTEPEAASKCGISTASIHAAEQPVELAVSNHVRTMPFLWLAVSDAPGPDSARALIERGSIALLSNYHRVPLDAPSANWLGKSSSREPERASGLWNQNLVDDEFDQRFLELIENHLAVQ